LRWALGVARCAFRVGRWALGVPRVARVRRCALRALRVFARWAFGALNGLPVVERSRNHPMTALGVGRSALGVRRVGRVPRSRVARSALGVGFKF